MSVDSLVNRYLQYKAGTAKVVTWLAQTARKVRDVTDILPALKAANNAAKLAKPNKSAAAEGTNVKVTTAQLLRLAQVIVDAGLRVPEEILRTIRVVIEGREHCAEWYMCMHSDATEQNDGHQYFIKIMKDIMRMFGKTNEPVVSAPAPANRSKSAAESITGGGINGFSNMFELLQIDEPSSNPLGSAPSKAPKTVTFELETTHDEKTFAIWCLLQDLRDLRLELKSLWLDYKHGKISYSNVSLLTSLGVGFLHSEQQDFINQHPDLESHSAIVEHFGLQIVNMHDDVFIYPRDVRTPSKVARGRVTADEIADLFCPRASLILRGCIEVLVHKIGRYQHPQIERAENLLRVHPLGELLLSLMPQLLAMSRKESASRAREDTFLAMLHELADHPHTRPHLYVVQALQIHMDIHDIVGSDVENELLQFRRILAVNLKRMQTLQGIAEARLSGAMQQTLLRDFAFVAEDYKRLAKDPYYRTELDKAASTPLARELYPLHKAFPAIPGQIIVTVAMSVHNRAITCCELDRVVLSAAYVYRAALRVGAITKPWADMEFVIESQSRSRPYVLETNISDGLVSMARAFGVALGMKPSAYRRGQRPKLLTTSAVERDGRRIVNDCPLVTAVKVKEGEDVTVPDDKTPLVQAGFQSLEQLQKSGLASERLAEVYQQYTKTGKLTPTHLLLAMKEEFVADEEDLHFDWIGFFETCLNLFRDIFTQCGSKMAVSHLSDPSIKKMNIPAFVCAYSILWDAVDRFDFSGTLEDSLLFRAATMMEKVIEQKGDNCVKLAQGKIRNLRRPAVPDKVDESKDRSEADDKELVGRFLGASFQETRDLGVFCSCTAEVEARITMRQLQQIDRYYPGKVAPKELANAACKVLAFALHGSPPTEREEVMDRLSRGLKVNMREVAPEAAHIEGGKVLGDLYVRGLQQIVKDGDKASKEGIDGKENAKPST